MKPTVFLMKQPHVKVVHNHSYQSDDNTFYDNMQKLFHAVTVFKKRDAG